ncbi:MAG: hypothetical protein IPH00_13060 [Flavobacteriales bacterium]|nr:hypothetical protein [Flavobacteriales bacterium]
MLRNLLSVALFSCLLHGQAQVITLTFTGQYQGDPVSLDSMLVLNLTQGGDVTLYYPDTVLVLGPPASAQGPRRIATASPSAPATPILPVTA